jgi:hypothetical protein
MSDTGTNKTEKTFTASESKQAIENHKTAATHLEKAKDSHLEAVKHHEAEDHDKAKKSTVAAQEQMKLANDAHKAVAKQHELTA